MDKKELLYQIAKNGNMQSKEAETCLELVLQTIREAIQQEGEVSIIGFGRFYTKRVASRMGRNPRTREVIEVPAYTKISFKAGSKLVVAAMRYATSQNKQIPKQLSS